MDLAINLDPATAGSVNFGDVIIGPNGDLEVTADVLGGTTNPVLQDVQIRLRTFLGEFFMDVSLGIPWLSLTRGANNVRSQLDAVVQNCILTTPGVLLLSSYKSSINTRQRILSISFTATSTSGPISYQGSVATSNASGGI